MKTVSLKKIRDLILDKKSKYLLISVGLTGMLMSSNILINSEFALYTIVAIFTVMMFSGLMYAQYIDRARRGLVFSWLLPVHLAVGYYLTFYYFPNLGPLVKVLAYLSFCLMSYVLLLVNNIFVVIIEKGSLIPLYTAAVAWVQILIIIISIPYISGVYKIPINFLVQNGVVFISAIMFNFYMIWVTYLDPDIKRTSSVERGYLAIALAFIVFIFGLGVSFIPTESFLRALFVSTVIMFGLGYVQGHYKNRINLRLLLEYGIISLIFLFLLILFRP